MYYEKSIAYVVADSGNGLYLVINTATEYQLLIGRQASTLLLREILPGFLLPMKQIILIKIQCISM
ncbi:MAG: hypothetical protein II205_02780, partial [Bacteroidales bacterium]|nr:hypothetical protein [Bacteroidales bacterium]